MLESLIMGGLSGAFSLIGGLGARQAAKSQQKRQAAYDAAAAESNRGLSKEMLSDIPVRIAKDAEVSGFNPVTWLQAGALGHYANAYGLRAATASQAINIPSVGQAVGDAGAAALSAFGTQRRFESSQALQSSMLDRQIGAISAARSGSKGRGVALPGATVGSSASTSILGGTGGPLFSSRAAPGATVGGSLSAGGKTETALPVFARSALPGYKADDQVYPYMRQDPAAPGSEKTEARYWEFGGAAQGLYNIVNDPFRAYHGRSIVESGQNIWNKLPDFSTWRSPFRNPNAGPQYRTGGGFNSDLTIPFVHQNFGTAGGF